MKATRVPQLLVLLGSLVLLSARLSAQIQTVWPLRAEQVVVTLITIVDANGKIFSRSAGNEPTYEAGALLWFGQQTLVKVMLKDDLSDYAVTDRRTHLYYENANCVGDPRFDPEEATPGITQSATPYGNNLLYTVDSNPPVPRLMLAYKDYKGRCFPMNAMVTSRTIIPIESMPDVFTPPFRRIIESNTSRSIPGIDGSLAPAPGMELSNTGGR